jgi:ribosomal protein S18 acetylase RimI-like enzyme
MRRPPEPVLRDYSPEVEAGAVWVTGEPLVAVIVLIEEGDSLQVENVAVQPAVQGTGIGRQLMEFAERQALARGLHRLTLYTNEVMTENIAFYTGLGYSEGDRREEHGYRRVFMKKELQGLPSIRSAAGSRRQ